jgi:rubrerythrin
MTVHSDLQKAVAAAESAKGTYATFAQATEDQSAKQMFESLSQDMDRHLSQLNSRLGVTAQNPLNETTNQQSSSLGSVTQIPATTNQQD